VTPGPVEPCSSGGTAIASVPCRRRSPSGASWGSDRVVLSAEEFKGLDLAAGGCELTSARHPPALAAGLRRCAAGTESVWATEIAT
jgi:hypothetical protein